MSNVGDLGRRVCERRRQLGLTIDEVAKRAHMHPSYLAMIEQSPSADPTQAALLRLSAALETTVEALSGAGELTPPGAGTRPSPRPNLTALTADECYELIGAGGIGRIVFDEERGPMAFPVNFKMLGDDVVFRTTPAAALAAAIALGRVSFEVDHIDNALSEGWSVVLSGEAEVIADPARLTAAIALGVVPWAGDRGDTYVRITPLVVTGRRIRGNPWPS